jgi:FtsH-binding integral membrane protein
VDELARPIRIAVTFLFLALVAVFAMTALTIVVPTLQESMPRAILWQAAVLGVLGLLLVVLSATKAIDLPLKRLLLLTGASAVGMVLSFVLHNLVYALATMVENVRWLAGLLSVVEAAFFLCAVIVCPLAFVVSSVGVIVVLIRTNKTPHHPTTGGLSTAH